jgi:hypothetical protein
MMRAAQRLGISGGATVDRERGRTDSNLQNRTDLVGAKRRPLHALVGPPRGLALLHNLTFAQNRGASSSNRRKAFLD